MVEWVTSKTRNTWLNKKASGFLEFDTFEAGLLCLLEMGDRRETIRMLTVASWGSSSLSGSVRERSLGGSTVDGRDGPAAGWKQTVVTSLLLSGSILEMMTSSAGCAVVERRAGSTSTTSTSSSPSMSESNIFLRSSGSSS